MSDSQAKRTLVKYVRPPVRSGCLGRLSERRSWRQRKEWRYCCSHFSCRN